MSGFQASDARVPSAALAIVAAGVAAALHIGKLPPAVPALQATLGIGLVEAGFLLALMQVAGMTLGMLAGLAADTIGLRRCMLAGLCVISLASLFGGWVGAFAADKAWAVPALLGLRGLEGAGFLLAVMPGPGLIRAVSPAHAEKSAMGLWGAYMPLGVALALLFGPALITSIGWPGLWWVVSAVSASAAVWVAVGVTPDGRRASSSHDRPAAQAWSMRLLDTFSAPGPRIVAFAFAVYASQWIAVIGFLPSIYTDAGVAAGWTATLTALAAALNIGGNVVGGRLLQRGVAPERLLRWGFALMALGGIAAFAQVGAPPAAIGLPPVLRYTAICLFSLGGGVVPATLFMLAVRLAPGPSTVSTTVGMVQQASSLGQFVAPPVVAWIAHRVGGWQWTWVVTLACSATGIILAGKLAAASRPRMGTT